MTTIIRNYQKDELISDAQDIYTNYTFEELDGAMFLTSCDITGAEIYHLTNDKVSWIQSIDLDWVAPYDERVLRTTSLDTVEVK
jgi:hypothetical protein